MNRKKLILCPKCRRSGFLSKRWVESVYYPRYTSLCLKWKNNQERLERTEYRGDPPETFGTINTDKSKFVRAIYGKYYYYYIGHYDPEKYQKDLERYKKGELKSKPNGRRWCKLNKDDYEESFNKDMQPIITKIRKGIGKKYRSDYKSI